MNKIEKARELTARKIFNEFGADINLDHVKFDFTDKWNDCIEIPISTSKIGPMALMISSLSVKIKAALCESPNTPGKLTLHLSYDFRYEHHDGGRNGCTRTKKYEI